MVPEQPPFFLASLLFSIVWGRKAFGVWDIKFLTQQRIWKLF